MGQFWVKTIALSGSILNDRQHEFVHGLNLPKLRPTVVQGGALTVEPGLFNYEVFNLWDDSNSHHVQEPPRH